MKCINKRNLKLVFFDVDVTLCESKCKMDKEMSFLLSELLNKYKVAIISGASYEQLIHQIVSEFSTDIDFKNFHVLPVQGGQYYSFKNGKFEIEYDNSFNRNEIDEIVNGINFYIKKSPLLQNDEIWGDQIDCRGSLVCLSALGQQAPIEIKKLWDTDGSKRLKIKEDLQEILPKYKVVVGGSTSVDITRFGIDKGYGVSRLCEILGLDLKNECIYVGDGIYEGGNDYEAIKMGVTGILTAGPNQTKDIIKSLLD